jgi:hypothetical protein
MRPQHAALVALFSLAFAGALVTPRAAQSADSDNARLVAISIALPDPDSEFGQSLAFGQNTGTKLTFQVKRPDMVFLEVDKDLSKLKSFTDDLGTVIATEDDWLWPFLHTPEDKHSGSFEVKGTKTPAPGAKEIRISAIVALRTGADLQTAEAKDIAFTKGTAVSAGPLSFKIGKSGKPDFGDMGATIELEAEHDFDAIQSMEFVAPDGRVIESDVQSTSGFSMNGKGSYTRTIGLKEAMAKGTIRVRWFASVKSVPFRVEGKYGVGF